MAIVSNRNGSGNEIIGTPVTIFHVMEAMRDRLCPSLIAKLLGVSEHDIDEAIEYIKANRASVEAAYEQRRVKRSPNSLALPE